MLEIIADCSPEEVRRKTIEKESLGFRVLSATHDEGRYYVFMVNDCQLGPSLEHSVRCLETGVTYPNVKRAADMHGTKPANIYKAIESNGTAARVHWAWA